MSDLGIPIGNSLSSLELEDEGGELDPEIILQQLLEDPGLTQHVTRTIDDGLETVIAYFRVGFEPQQLRQVLHVPISPSMKTLPTIEAHATDQQDVRIRVTDCQKFGARLEVIKSSPNNEASQVLVEVVATENVT